MRLLLLLSLICIQLFASAPVKTEGKLSVKGNTPFTFLALTEPGGKIYRITGKHEAALLRLQGHIVRIEGMLIEAAKGPGFPAVLNVTSYVIRIKGTGNFKK